MAALIHRIEPNSLEHRSRLRCYIKDLNAVHNIALTLRSPDTWNQSWFG